MNFNTSKIRVTKKDEAVNVNQFVENLLRIPLYINDKGESVGLSYTEIQDNVDKVFPHNKMTYNYITTLASLLRKAGEELPIRLRKRYTHAKTETTKQEATTA